jgi:hypothetical protein
MTKSQIISNLYLSREVNTVMSYIPKKHREDLKHYVFEKLLQMNWNKFRRINKNNGLINYFKRMIWIQWNLNNKTIRKGYWLEHGEIDNIEIDDDITEFIEEEKTEQDIILNLLDDKVYMNTILDKFFKINTNSVNYFFNRCVFELYFYEGMKITEIAKETDIGYESIRKSVNFTLQFVRKEIFDEIKK